jgi:hypothetical protein
MKRIITTILLLMPLFLMAQTAPPILQGSKYYEFRNAVRVDSAFFIPRKDTLFFDNTLKAPGMITWRPADSTLYMYRGNRWISILSSSTPGVALDSARRSNDTLFFRYTTGGELAVKIAGLPISATVGLQDSLNARLRADTGDYIKNQDVYQQNANSRYKKNTVDELVVLKGAYIGLDIPYDNGLVVFQDATGPVRNITIGSYGRRSTLLLDKRAGSLASPSAVTPSDTIGGVYGYGYNGVPSDTGIRGAGILFIPTETHTSTAAGTRIVLTPVKNGTRIQNEVLAVDTSVTVYAYDTPTSDNSDSTLVIHGGRIYRKVNTYADVIPSMVTYPDSFLYRPVQIFRDRDQVWRTNIKDLRAYAAGATIDSTTSAVYLDCVNGNDVNSGTSLSSAVASFGAAVLKSRLIYVARGIYDVNKSLTVLTDVSSSPLVIIALDPENTYFTSSAVTSLLTWSLHSGQTYKCTRSAVYSVIDFTFRDTLGNIQMYPLATDSATCVATAGTYWTNNVTTYVHTLDGRNPDDNLKLLLASSQVIEVNGTAPFYYIEGIKFYGSNVYGAIQVRHLTADSLPRATVYFNKCEFAYNQTPTGGGNGLGLINLKEVWVWDCQAHDNWADGLNYHTNEASFSKMKVFQYNSNGYNNGFYNSTIINNGSTVHDGITILRIGGLYFNNRGPNVADVNFNTKSYNVGVTSKQTLISPSDVNASDFTAADCKMWLNECVSSGSRYSASQAGTGTIYTKNSFLKVLNGNVINY